MSTSKRKINVISLGDKLKIVNAFENGKSRYDIQLEFGVPESTFYRIIKFKDSIKAQCTKGNRNVKRRRYLKFPNVEKRLVKWIDANLDKNIHINRSYIKKKSKEFAKELGIPNFRASNGWLEGFKKRLATAFKKAAEENKTLCECFRWSDAGPSFLEGYNESLDDVPDIVPDEFLEVEVKPSIEECSKFQYINFDNDGSGFEDDETNGSSNKDIKPFIIRGKSNPTNVEALNALETLDRFFGSSCNIDESVFEMLFQLAKHIKNAKPNTQKKITDYYMCLRK